MIAGFAGQSGRAASSASTGRPGRSKRATRSRRIARRTAEVIGLGRDLRDDEIVLDDRYHAGTYGIPDDRTLEAMRLDRAARGMITDPVYEGKSMAGLIDLVRRGEIDRGLHRALRAPRRPAGDQRL